MSSLAFESLDGPKDGLREGPNALGHKPGVEGAHPSPLSEPGEQGPLRILMSGYRSNPYSGGQGVYLRHMSKALVDQGHEVDVVSGPPYPHLDERIRLTKLPSLDLYAAPNPFWALKREHLRSRTDFYEWWAHNSGAFPEPFTFGQRLAAYLSPRHGRYDVLHDNQTLSPGLLNIRNLGLPVVSTIHHPITRDRDIALDHARHIFERMLLRRWFSFLKMQSAVSRDLDHLITVSQRTKEDVVEAFGVKPGAMEVIHNGIDTDIFQPIPEIPRKPNRLIATASADVPLKGLIYLIEAYAALLPQHPDLELVVIGTLREGATMRLLRALGIKDKVRFLSDLSDRDIAEAYAEATIAVSPSVYEGFGLPAGEAMACGVPLVTTDGGALPEVAGDAAIIVPHSNAQALASAIGQLLDDPEKRATLGRAGRARVLRHFTWEQAAEKAIQIYRKAIAHADR